MVGEISESVAAFFYLDDDLRRFLGAFEDRGVLVERLECGVLEEAVPAALLLLLVGWQSHHHCCSGSLRHSRCHCSNSSQSYHGAGLVPVLLLLCCVAVAIGCFVLIVACGWQVTEEVRSRWIRDLEQPA